KVAQPELQGNLLLDRLLGAEVHFVPPSADPKIATGDQEATVVAQVMANLEERGERPYLIPIGGSSPVGALGYVAATREMLDQLSAMGESPCRLYYAAGSRGTEAGLVLGAKLYAAPYRLCGIAISSSGPEKTARAVRIANEAAALMGVSTRVDAKDIVTETGYIGPGYGIPTAGCLEAITLLARSEGIFLDPVYTGKVMAALIDHILRGEIAPEETVLFLHSGGTPALFAYADQLEVCTT